MLKHLGITCHDSDSLHTHTSWMCMEREYRWKMLTTGESKWKGMESHCIIFPCLGLSSLGKRNLMGNFRKGLGVSGHSEGAGMITAQPPLSAPLPCSWAPVRLSDIILLLGPSWYQPCHHRSVPRSCKAPSLLRMTKKLNPIPHHLSWPLLIFFFFIVFSFLFLFLCQSWALWCQCSPTLCSPNRSPFSAWPNRHLAVVHTTLSLVLWSSQAPITQSNYYRLDFTGSPLAKNPCFHHSGTGSIPSQGTNIPNALWSGHKRRKKKKKSLNNRHLFLPVLKIDIQDQGTSRSARDENPLPS